jgi:16S rRNA (guanine527-N7)-methyltransferase
LTQPAEVTPLDAEAFRQEADVSRETLARLERYLELLGKWTQAINLVAKSTLEDPWRRHFLDSAQLYDRLPPKSADRDRVLVDLGSGAGFPGLVLAIMGAGTTHLIESDRRKAAFLREVARATDTEVTVHDRRIEAVPPFAADVVVARACAPLDRLLAYAAPFLQPAGAVATRCLFLKGRRVDEELTEANKAWRLSVECFPSRTDPAGTVLSIGVNSLDATRS